MSRSTGWLEHDNWSIAMAGGYDDAKSPLVRASLEPEAASISRPFLEIGMVACFRQPSLTVSNSLTLLSSSRTHAAHHSLNH